jgi:hypothetical protein
MREHDVSALTAAELEAARRELAASLVLARPGSPVRAVIEPAWPPSTPNWPDGPPPGQVYLAPRVPSLHQAGTRVEKTSRHPWRRGVTMPARPGVDRQISCKTKHAGKTNPR